MTTAVGKMLGYVPGGSRTYNYDQAHAAGSIDSYIFADLQAKNITPAPKTTDWEFIRRVTLDLTGRIPNPDRVLSFVADTAPDKRAKLIDELMAKPEWVDKWTMFYGDLFKNTTNKASTSLNRFAQGRNAFYQWIKQSLTDGKPYNQMATELLSIQSDSTYTDGAADFLVGSIVTGGPTQDIIDQMTADTFDTFLCCAITDVATWMPSVCGRPAPPGIRPGNSPVFSHTPAPLASCRIRPTIPTSFTTRCRTTSRISPSTTL